MAVRQLTDTMGNRADFDAAGRLIGLRCGRVEWPLAEAASGWSAVARIDGHEVDTSADAAVDWHLHEGLLQGSLRLEGEAPSGELYALAFPDITISYADATATSLVVPTDTGWVIEEAARGLNDDAAQPGLRFSQLPMQCLGWIEAGRGLYLDTRDIEGWLREWRFEPAGAGRVRIRCLHLLSQEGAVPFLKISLGGFEGGWYELAQIYRRWALQAPWAARGPDERRGGFVADIACWVWNRGRAAQAGPPAKELARRIGAPVTLDWYWWHRHGYDTEYPDYFPPREGEEAFAAAVRDLQAHDVRVQIYTNGMCHDVDGRAWLPDGPQVALMQQDGSWFAPAYNTFTQHRLASVCGDAPRWRPILLGIVEKARALRIDGLYLDMIGAVGGQRPCYHPDHPHAPGGGCYGVQGFRRLLAEARAARPGFPLSTESSLEWFLDLFDSHIICGVSLERLKWHAEACGGRVCPVPLFSAVYHGRTVCFGNYSLLDGIPPYDELWPPEERMDPAKEKDWVALCPDQFALELARTVSFGYQPLVANLRMEHFDDPRLAADIQFLIDVCKLYFVQREFLLWGRMLPPGRLECPDHTTTFLQRFLFTKPGEETYLQRTYPAIFHSAWEAPDGRRAALLINYTRTAVPYHYEVGGEYFSGELPARTAACLALKGQTA